MLLANCRWSKKHIGSTIRYTREIHSSHTGDPTHTSSCYLLLTSHCHLAPLSSIFATPNWTINELFNLLWCATGLIDFHQECPHQRFRDSPYDWGRRGTYDFIGRTLFKTKQGCLPACLPFFRLNELNLQSRALNLVIICSWRAIPKQSSEMLDHYKHVTSLKRWNMER